MTGLLKEFAAVVQEFGPVASVIAALVIFFTFFVWSGYKREGRLERRIRELETMYKVVVPLMEDCKEQLRLSRRVIAQNSLVLRKLFGRGSR